MLPFWKDVLGAGGLRTVAVKNRIPFFDMPRKGCGDNQSPALPAGGQMLPLWSQISSVRTVTQFGERSFIFSQGRKRAFAFFPQNRLVALIPPRNVSGMHPAAELSQSWNLTANSQEFLVTPWGYRDAGKSFTRSLLGPRSGIRLNRRSLSGRLLEWVRAEAVGVD